MDPNIIPWRVVVAFLVAAAILGMALGWITGPYGLVPVHP